jgi:hypothetical protein
MLSPASSTYIYFRRIHRGCLAGRLVQDVAARVIACALAALAAVTADLAKFLIRELLYGASYLNEVLPTGFGYRQR